MPEFKPTTTRQQNLVEELSRLVAKQQQSKQVIQFSERDQDYFTTNINVAFNRLQETVEKKLSFDPATGVVQFAEEQK